MKNTCVVFIKKSQWLNWYIRAVCNVEKFKVVDVTFDWWVFDNIAITRKPNLSRLSWREEGNFLVVLSTYIFISSIEVRQLSAFYLLITEPGDGH